MIIAVDYRIIKNARLSIFATLPDSHSSQMSHLYLRSLEIIFSFIYSAKSKYYSDLVDVTWRDNSPSHQCEKKPGVLHNLEKKWLIPPDKV